jgi:membrane-associated phospholipid phosphatase
MAVDLAYGFTTARRPLIGKRLALWTLSAVVLVGASILFADRPIATWSHDVLHRPALAVEITKAAKWWILCGIAAAILLGAFVVRVTGGRLGPALRTAIAVAAATLLATIAVLFLKYAFGRLWPETWVHNNPSWIGGHHYAFQFFHGGEGNDSFPSGHTARMTAPFAVLWQRLPRLRVLWVLPTLIITAGLVASDFHFLGDCLAGAYVGIASAAAVLLVL